MANPFYNSSFGDFGDFGVGRPHQPYMPEEQQRTLLERLGSGALTGLGAVGEFLDKYTGGRAVRGLLGGKPEELLSILPFSDALGVTDPSNAVSGRQLLGVSEDEPILSGGGLGGMAAEMLLSPASYLSFGAGALSKSGQLAKKAGVKLPSTGAGRAATTLDDVMTAKGFGDLGQVTRQNASIGNALKGNPLTDGLLQGTLGGNLGVGLPFMGNAFTTDAMPALRGVGNALAGLPGIGGMLGAAGRGVANTADAINRYGGAVFKKSRMGQTDPGTIHVAEAISGGRQDALSAARGRLLPIQDELLRTGAWDDPQKLTAWVRHQELGEPLPPGMERLGPLTDDLLAGELQLAREAGRPAGNLAGDLGYFPRQETLGRETVRGGKRGLTPLVEPGREHELFGSIATRGPQSLNELSQRDDLLGLKPLQSQEKIAKEYLGLPADTQVMPDYINKKRVALSEVSAKMEGFRQDLANIESIPQWKSNPGIVAAHESVLDDIKRLEPEHFQLKSNITELESKLAQSKNLDDWYRKLTPEQRKAGYFSNHPYKDLVWRVMRNAESNLRSSAMNEGVAALAQPLAQLGADGVPLLQVLEEAGMTMGGVTGTMPGAGAAGAPVAAQVAGGNQAQTALKEALAKLGVTGDVTQFGIPRAQAEALTKMGKALTVPDGLEVPLKIFDSVTNLTKLGQTVPWPATHSRNQVSALWQGWLHGMYDPTVPGGALNPWAYLKPMYSGWALRQGKPVKELETLFPGMAPQEALKQFHKEVIQFDVMGKHTKEVNDLAGVAAKQAGSDILVPGTKLGPGFKESLKTYAFLGDEPLKQKGNPLNTRGVGDAERTLFGPFKGGQEITEHLDDINKLGGYLTKRLQGFDPAAAKAAVTEAFFDFSNLSQIESAGLRRAVPFYSWARQNLGHIADQLMTQPGGKMATSIKAAGDLRGENPGLLPTWLGSGAATPLGAEEDGKQRFLTRLGLPFEDVGQWFGEGLRGPLGALNPMVKAPVELALGRQFFSGRDLQDLYSVTGNVPAEQLLMNSPVGRVWSTGRQLADERKGPLARLANVATGVRVSDVDMERARDVRLREIVQERLQGSPNVGTFTRPYVRRDRAAQLTPAEAELLGLYRSAEHERRQRR